MKPVSDRPVGVMLAKTPPPGRSRQWLQIRCRIVSRALSFLGGGGHNCTNRTPQAAKVASVVLASFVRRRPAHRPMGVERKEPDVVVRSRVWKAGTAAVALMVLAGCAPVSGPSPSGSPTLPPSPTATSSPSSTASPTPTSTWSPEQAAAVDAVERFLAATNKILSDPSSFTSDEMTELLSKSSGGEAMTASVGSFATMREKGYRLEGSAIALSMIATEAVDSGRGTEVHVTVCMDQTSLKAVDKNGDPVTEERYQYPDHLLRQLSVRQPDGQTAFLVFGFQTVAGECP